MVNAALIVLFEVVSLAEANWTRACNEKKREHRSKVKENFQYQESRNERFKSCLCGIQRITRTWRDDCSVEGRRKALPLLEVIFVFGYGLSVQFHSQLFIRFFFVVFSLSLVTVFKFSRNLIFCSLSSAIMHSFLPRGCC